MNPNTLNAFSDELTKIAVFKKLRDGFVNAMRTGWHGHGPEGSPTRLGWTGQGMAPAAERAQMGRIGKAWDSVSSLGGLTKHLPVGPKSMMLAGTAMMLPQVLAKEDPTGQERSRTERTVGFGANTLGGLAGGGALIKTRFGQKHPILASMIGGLGGGIAAEKLVTAPFKKQRKKKEIRRRQQEEAAALDFYPTGPVGRMAIGSGAVPPTMVGGTP